MASGHTSSVNDNILATFSERWKKYWVLLILIFTAVALVQEWYLLALLPLFIGTLFWVIIDYRVLYSLFFVTIPFSIEVYFSNGLGTDLPSEPIMISLTGLAILLFISKGGAGIRPYLFHPITAMLILHLGWILLTSLTAVDQMRSLKFLLAKCWYVIPFYFLSLHILKEESEIIKNLRLVSYLTIVAMGYVFFKHALEGFSFKSSNDVVQPIFRNHVNYACLLVLVLPYMVLISKYAKAKWLHILGILFFLVCIYLSFTRAAILCILIGLGAYFIIKQGWVRQVLIIAIMTILVGTTYLGTNNNFLKLAPNFEKTITHTKFDNLIEATYKMEDISTMERLYRWVAGAEMVADRPFFGFGPNNFYVNYSKYTISAFQTYVSDNPDQSGIHNYYLMTAVDQGLLGLIILVGLIAIVLVLGEYTYHRLSASLSKDIVITAMVSFIIILSLNLINDLLETDKVGPFFFLNMAIIAIYFVKAAGMSRANQN